MQKHLPMHVLAFFVAGPIVWSSVNSLASQATNALRDLPSFTYHGVVLESSNLKYQPHQDVIYPTVVRMRERVASPHGAFYMYYAPHDAPGGICLAQAEKLEGPWAEYTNNPVISHRWGTNYQVSHVSGPDAIWNEAERKVFLYYHGENDTTRLATSADGVHFDYEGIVLTTAMFKDINEASYGRVFEHRLPGKNNKYIMLLMGNNKGTRRIYLAWSQDGRTWASRRTAVLDPPPGTDQAAGAIYLERHGKDYILFHANNSRGGFNVGYDLYAAEADAGFQHVRHLGKYLERTFVSPDNPAVMSPTIVAHDGKLYLFFNIGARLHNRIALAVSRAE